MNNPLIVAFGYIYIVGALITWWILDKSVEHRSPIAAVWPLAMPILILSDGLEKADDQQEEDDE